MAQADQPQVHQRILDLLRQRGVDFQLTSHRPVYTSPEAAQVRGESLHSGAKAILVKADDRFVLLVLPGDRALDSKQTRKLLACKTLRFASPEEVRHLTTLSPGAIPPFGSLFGLSTYCDRSLADNDCINFNAGTHTESIRLRYADYIAAEQPTVADFSRPPR